MSNNSSTEYRIDLRLGQSPYLFISSIVCNFLDLIHRMVFDFYFDGVTVKTGNNTIQTTLNKSTLFKGAVSSIFSVTMNSPKTYLIQ